jgi:hypothetical protein
MRQAYDAVHPAGGGPEEPVLVRAALRLEEVFAGTCNSDSLMTLLTVWGRVVVPSRVRKPSGVLDVLLMIDARRYFIPELISGLAGMSCSSELFTRIDRRSRASICFLLGTCAFLSFDVQLMFGHT